MKTQKTAKVSELFPLDFDALKKGEVITQERIETIYRVRELEDPEKFRLAQMKLVEQIEEHRFDLYPRMKKNTVIIMQDAEAEEYNCERMKKHVSSLQRDTRRRARIERKSFDEVSRRAAESRDIGYGALAAVSARALRKANQEAKRLSASSEED